MLVHPPTPTDSGTNDDASHHGGGGGDSSNSDSGSNDSDDLPSAWHTILHLDAEQPQKNFRCGK